MDGTGVISRYHPGMFALEYFMCQCYANVQWNCTHRNNEGDAG